MEIKSTTTNTPTSFSKLGRELKLSPKTLVSVNNSGYKTEYFTPTVEVIIGIGNDHIAKLIMDVEAWEALKSGKEVLLTTAKEFREGIK